MADGLVQVQPDSTGKKVDTSELTVSGNTVERQRMVVADPTNATSLATVKAGSTALDGTEPALAVALSPNTPVTLPAITKGTQGANGITTQELHDAGRSILTLTYTNQASATTTTVTTLTTLVQNSNYVSSTGITAFQVPAGQTLRIQSLSANGRAAATTTTIANAANCIYVEVRVATTNTTTALTTAPIAAFLGIPIAVSGATSGLYEGHSEDSEWSDGVEVPAGKYVGITMHNAITSTAVILHSVALVGYTY